MFMSMPYGLSVSSSRLGTAECAPQPAASRLTSGAPLLTHTDKPLLLTLAGQRLFNLLLPQLLLQQLLPPWLLFARLMSLQLLLPQLLLPWLLLPLQGLLRAQRGLRSRDVGAHVANRQCGSGACSGIDQRDSIAQWPNDVLPDERRAPQCRQWLWLRPQLPSEPQLVTRSCLVAKRP
mmetsp:Transcript_40296/g.120187  ORF Transcript_40296/g.120187 Transcript_40296/m.120187 type:complete len:178 (-) Transcript_40296:332-865(-)